MARKFSISNSQFSIRNTTKQKPPRVSFALLKDEILGKQFEVSLVFCGSALSRSLNRQYRLKDKVGNVLAFPLSAQAGEIFICLEKAKRECQKFDMKYSQFIAYLFIHGSLHLKGMTHGAKMEKLENKILNVATHRSWY